MGRNPVFERIRHFQPQFGLLRRLRPDQRRAGGVADHDERRQDRYGDGHFVRSAAQRQRRVAVHHQTSVSHSDRLRGQDLQQRADGRKGHRNQLRHGAHLSPEGRHAALGARTRPDGRGRVGAGFLQAEGVAGDGRPLAHADQPQSPDGGQRAEYFRDVEPPERHYGRHGRPARRREAQPESRRRRPYGVLRDAGQEHPACGQHRRQPEPDNRGAGRRRVRPQAYGRRGRGERPAGKGRGGRGDRRQTDERSCALRFADRGQR